MEVRARDVLRSFYEFMTMGISPVAMTVNLLVALGIAIFIYFIYRKTFSGVAYAKNYNISLVITCLISAMAMMMLRSNLALSLGTLGVLSIIRFRNAVKEPKDISYMFWAIIAGLCAGTSAYLLAIIGSVVIAVVLLLFSSASENYLTYLLIVEGSGFNVESLENTIKNKTKRFKVRTKDINEIYRKHMYEVYLKKNTDEMLITEVNRISGISKVNVIAYNNDIGR